MWAQPPPISEPGHPLFRHRLSLQQPHSVIQRRILGSSVDKEPNSLAQPSDLEDEGKQLQHQTNKEIVYPHLCDNRSDPPHLCDEGSQIICLNDERPKPPHPCEETLGGWKENILLIPCKVCTQDVRAKLSIEHQQNFISRSFAERLGFGISLEKGNPEELNVDIELGTERLKGKAVLMDNGVTEFILGLSALVTLKSCIDLDKGVLKTPSQEISFLSPLKRECISART
ncbi:nuclear receptor-interacting protein 2 isoform X2 [Bombina bombina]|uniref:nuclear receptor-interacting protein 2 isoform X2 n=1 Tax=Bombina bombina TaxID=8345 RepID=UPI00235B2BB7|nr:nuclear receptor-interacting protein 2 isoform X2 [Bombina bombina]